MGRHADTTSARRLPARPTPVALVVALVVVALVAGGLVWWLAGSGGGCDETRTVRVTVAPELAPVAQDLLAEPQDLGDGTCAGAEVTAQEPLQTVGDLQALEAAALPQVWVPDSSLWTVRAADADLESSGSMATSPVVLGTSRAAVDELGWGAEPPSWAEALSGVRPVAVPDLAESAEGLSALAALRTSLGGDESADNAVVQAVLAARRGPSVSPADALEAAGSGAADAPLVPVSEQEVVATTREAADSQLVPVYPSEGSPRLDYPVLRVGGPSEEERSAVDAVVRTLTSATARTAVLGAGFRDAEGTAPTDAGESVPQEAPEAVEVDAEQVQGLLTELSSLAAPSRILTVFDISTSMEAPAGDGTRATLARDAAKSTLTLVPGNFALGLWFFAHELEEDRDWTEAVPTRALESEVEGSSQRDLLDAELDTIPDRLSPGGTGLYDTTLDAVRAARSDFDPTAVNSVLVVTDGTNDDDGTSLDALLQTLQDEADPERPVKVIGVALGPDADIAALERIAEATGGAAYSAVDPTDFQGVLFDALRQR
ncbi:von Willebrand factor type A domain-containing protein [Geodermatophilus tzadiensis]|uniref:von Willebrand factor type A domain-containing protein n=1 Tax=Geodermatophilus tzadiensis TaxID=1137988 RepID=A0A2T0TRP1_9ACTN|nr:VWA domain-containing protein [Geodermatophilus tzadiensis]PRY48188.1 von Willebrand factor type A domain-containing protein [Geodermatophilus tzadiensis]